WLKAQEGELAALRDPVLFGRRELGESAFRAELARRPAVAKQAALLDSIAAVVRDRLAVYRRAYAFIPDPDLGSATLARAALLAHTALADATRVPGLLAGDLAASDDPALAFARRVGQALGPAQERSGTLAARAQSLAARLARARFDVYGKTLPPDATFTLRLA